MTDPLAHSAPLVAGDLLDRQRRLARWALGRADDHDLEGLVEGPGLWVHRNTTRLTLTDALGDLYPVVRQMVGDVFFAQAAKAFLRVSAPSAATLLRWGGAFPDFLQTCEQAASLPYLPDLARLEWYRHVALHGAEAVPLTAEDVAQGSTDRADDLTLTLHPTASLLTSDWPVLELWLAHQTADGLDHLEFSPRRQECLIIRPHARVQLFALPDGGGRFLRHLERGIGPAIDDVTGHYPGFDAGAVLALALGNGWFQNR